MRVVAVNEKKTGIYLARRQNVYRDPWLVAYGSHAREITLRIFDSDKQQIHREVLGCRRFAPLCSVRS